MNSIEQKRCHNLILKYKWASWINKRCWHTEQEKEVWNQVKSDLRNSIFEIVKIDLLKYVKQCLRKWNKYEPQEEVLSLSWTAFYFCLEKYKNFERPLSLHFFSFTRYFLLGHYGKKDQVFLSLDDLQDILSIEPTEGNILFMKLMNVQDYRLGLNKKYWSIFDDAFQSLHPAPKLRNGRWDQQTGFPQKVYDNLKSVFKDTILFLIK